MNINFFKYRLQFNFPAGTSRGTLQYKDSWFVEISKDGKIGIGECGVLKGLSIDDLESYEQNLKACCNCLESGVDLPENILQQNPSIQAGFEMALRSFKNKDPFKFYENDFTCSNTGISINGLVWMGSKQFMLDQLKKKVEQGFNCIKIKVGAIDFQEEVELLKYFRKELNSKDLSLRLDANGGFDSDEALEKLKVLSEFDIHSLEQPIAVNQWDSMTELCQSSPIPIALDEELIGHYGYEKKQEVLKRIKPQYIILKPSLLGGFEASNEWIHAANELDINYWATSALESNVGLNAIAQWAYELNLNIPQGLGTGLLYTNNFISPLEIENGHLWYRDNKPWKIWL